jgi:hypothetical protein
MGLQKPPDSKLTNELIQLKTLVDQLNSNLRIKENVIESTNDALVLKEAEIARLKTRVCLIERNMNNKKTTDA